MYVPRCILAHTHVSNVAVENVAVECAAAALYSNNFLPGDAYDPFNSTAVRVNQLNHNLLQFFLKVGWKAHLKTFSHTNTSQWSQSFKNLPDITTGSLPDEMHMDAFLTLNATRMSFYKLATFDRANSRRLSWSNLYEVCDCPFPACR